MITAKVHRPAFVAGTENPLVTLTATVTHGSVTKEYDLPLKVKMEGILDSQSVILDLTDLSFPSEVISDLVLTTIGKNGSKITWESSGSAISSKGIVQRPDSGTPSAPVVLTATATKGTETQTKDFNITVKSWTTVEEIDSAAILVNWDLIKGTNNNSQGIKDNLVLPALVGRGVSAVWTTPSAALVAATGVITRPTYTTGPVTLNITCTLTHSGLVRVIAMDPFIVATKPITFVEAVAAAKQMLDPSLFIGANLSMTNIISDMQLPYRVSDINASVATIAWTLADSSHVALLTSPNVTLVNNADYTLADVTRPTLVTGNVRMALLATITAGTGVDKATDTKYFDFTILVE